MRAWARVVVVGLAMAFLAGGCQKAAVDELRFGGPSLQSVAMGETLSGTDIRYVGHNQAGAQVLVGGQQAVKKSGDSLDWKGSPVAGVNVSLVQRVLFADAQRLITVGVVNVAVQNPSLAEAQFPLDPAYSYAVAVAHNVSVGDRIPGTTITYQGRGDGGARLGGVTGIAYRQLGDSISWQGRLRANVYLDMTLRVVAYENNAMQVAGTAVIALTGSE